MKGLLSPYNPINKANWSLDKVALYCALGAESLACLPGPVESRSYIFITVYSSCIAIFCMFISLGLNNMCLGNIWVSCIDYRS